MVSESECTSTSLFAPRSAAIDWRNSSICADPICTPSERITTAFTPGSCSALVRRAVSSRNDVPGGLNSGSDSSAGDSLSGPARLNTATVGLAAGASAAATGRMIQTVTMTANAANRRMDMMYLEAKGWNVRSVRGRVILGGSGRHYKDGARLERCHGG